MDDGDAELFDLRELDYEWENNIFDMFRTTEDYGVPYSVVVSDLCRKGFAPVDNKAGSRFFDDFDVALNMLSQQAEDHLKPLSDDDT